MSSEFSAKGYEMQRSRIPFYFNPNGIRIPE